MLLQKEDTCGHFELNTNLPSLFWPVADQVRKLRQQVKEGKKAFDKTEDDLKALQSVGQIIGEVLRQLDSEKCKEKDRRSSCLPRRRRRKKRKDH